MLWNYLKNVNKPILLYGMGNGADKILDRLNTLHIPVEGVFASDGFARHNGFRGYTVISYSEAKEKYKDMIVLICFGSQRPEVLELFKKVDSENETYAPDVPVYGDNVFDLEFARKNEARLIGVYNRLCDEHSKKVFENTVMYKLTGKLDYLFSCETSAKEAYASIINPLPGHTFCDLGAYNGDTVNEFVSHCPEYGHILAIEPDKRSFRKLGENTNNLHNISIYNVAAYSEKCVLPFSMAGGRQSKIAEGGVPTQCESLDGLLCGNRADYIKMDVEGFEIEAISGCKETILRYKPTLCISAYHRSEDYFTLPEAVFSIRDDYKMHMRHFPYIPAWDTCFYFT